MIFCVRILSTNQLGEQGPQSKKSAMHAPNNTSVSGEYVANNAFGRSCPKAFLAKLMARAAPAHCATSCVRLRSSQSQVKQTKNTLAEFDAASEDDACLSSWTGQAFARAVALVRMKVVHGA